MSTSTADLRCSALVVRADAVLVLERQRQGGVDWVLPGGTPKPHESTASCVIREVEEETGLRVGANRVAFVLEANDHDDLHTLDIVFACTEFDAHGEPEEREPGLRPRFWPVDELGQLNLRPPVAGHVRGLLAAPVARTAAYLGNLWRPVDSTVGGEESTGATAIGS